MVPSSRPADKSPGRCHIPSRPAVKEVCLVALCRPVPSRQNNLSRCTSPSRPADNIFPFGNYRLVPSRHRKFIFPSRRQKSHRCRIQPPPADTCLFPSNTSIVYSRPFSPRNMKIPVRNFEFFTKKRVIGRLISYNFLGEAVLVFRNSKAFR